MMGDNILALSPFNNMQVKKRIDELEMQCCEDNEKIKELESIIASSKHEWKRGYQASESDSKEKIDRLTINLEELEKELELRSSWVLHHQKAAELNSTREHKLEDKIKVLELKITELQASNKEAWDLVPWDAVPDGDE